MFEIFFPSNELKSIKVANKDWKKERTGAMFRAQTFQFGFLPTSISNILWQIFYAIGQILLF